MHRGLQALALGAALAFATVQGAAADELSGTLKKIKETGVITLGRSEQSVPFSYLGDDGQPIGYSIDLCLRIVDAERAGEALSVEDPAALSQRGDRHGAALLRAWLALAAGSSIRRRPDKARAGQRQHVAGAMSGREQQAG